MTQAELNAQWCMVLLDGLAACGVRHAVMSPGSRSTPLAMAALSHGGVSVRVILDERSAGFFALGLAKATGQPVVLIATSGSAIANWHPAVVEAHMAHHPLILLSADRPPELQDCGANQTVQQVGMFGPHVRACHPLPPPDDGLLSWLSRLTARVVQQAMAPVAGPVQVNVPLREPLVCVQAVARPSLAPPPRLIHPPPTPPVDLEWLLPLMAGERGMVVCGPQDLGAGFRQAVGDLSRHLGVPILADMASGLRCGHGAAAPYPDALARRMPDAHWVLRFGPYPMSRSVGDYLSRCPAAAQVQVGAVPADANGSAGWRLDVDPAALCRWLLDRLSPRIGWDAEVQSFLRRVDRLADDACAPETLFEGSVLRHLFPVLPTDTPVFLGNSLTVRAADWFCGAVPQPVALYGNRGVSGIDGNLSTFFGIAAASRRPAVAVVGDLTLLHDASALALGRDLPTVVVVLDNGGGGIFDHLPQADLPYFATGWLTPQQVDLAALAQAYGVSYARVSALPELLSGLLGGLAGTGTTLLHVPIDRNRSLDRCRWFHSAVSQLEV